MLAKNDPHKLRLKADAFNAVVKNVHGTVLQQEIAWALNLHPSHWSEIRSGKRWFNPYVADAMILLPGIPVESYCEPVPVSASEATS